MARGPPRCDEDRGGPACPASGGRGAVYSARPPRRRARVRGARRRLARHAAPSIGGAGVRGSARLGEAGHGTVRRGGAGPGQARRGAARFGPRRAQRSAGASTFTIGCAARPRLGAYAARLGKARRGRARQGGARRGTARRGCAGARSALTRRRRAPRAMAAMGVRARMALRRSWAALGGREGVRLANPLGRRAAGADGRPVGLAAPLPPRPRCRRRRSMARGSPRAVARGRILLAPPWQWGGVLAPPSRGAHAARLGGAWPGTARLGLAWRGLARHGKARPPSAIRRRGLCVHDRMPRTPPVGGVRGVAGLGWAGPGSAGYGLAWSGLARLGAAGFGWAWRGLARAPVRLDLRASGGGSMLPRPGGYEPWRFRLRVCASRACPSD